MHAGLRCPCEPKETDGQHNGPGAHGRQARFGRHSAGRVVGVGFGIGDGAEIVFLTDGREAVADDETETDTEKGETGLA